MRTVLAPCLALILSACQSSPASLPNNSPTPQMQVVRVARAMQECWFKRKDPTFARYKMASEVNSFSGKPRVLIVPKNKPTALPQLVIQSERVGGRAQLSAFGPLMQSSEGPRIAREVDQWSRGGSTCSRV